MCTQLAVYGFARWLPGAAARSPATQLEGMEKMTRPRHISIHLYLSFPTSQPQFLYLYWKSGDSKGSHSQPLAVETLILSFFVLKENHYTLKPAVHEGLAKVPVGHL